MSVNIKIENGIIKEINISKQDEVIALRESIMYLDKIGMPIESLSYELFENYKINNLNISIDDAFNMMPKLNYDTKYEFSVFMISYMIYKKNLEDMGYKKIVNELNQLACYNHRLYQMKDAQPKSEFEETIEMLITSLRNIIKLLLSNSDVRSMIGAILIVIIIALLISY